MLELIAFAYSLITKGRHSLSCIVLRLKDEGRADKRTSLDVLGDLAPDPVRVDLQFVELLLRFYHLNIGLCVYCWC